MKQSDLSSSTIDLTEQNWLESNDLPEILRRAKMYGQKRIRIDKKHLTSSRYFENLELLRQAQISVIVSLSEKDWEQGKQTIMIKDIILIFCR